MYKDYTGKELQEKFFPKRTIRSLESMADILGVTGKTEETYIRSRAFQAKIVGEKLKGLVKNPEWCRKISESKRNIMKPMIVGGKVENVHQSSAK